MEKLVENEMESRDLRGYVTCRAVFLVDSPKP